MNQKGKIMTETCIIKELPYDEVEYIMALHKESLKEGSAGVSGRLMKELSIPMLKILNEEFNKDAPDCVFGMVSFFTSIAGNIISNTVLVEDVDSSCEMMKKIFCMLIDQIKSPLQELKKSRS